MTLAPRSNGCGPLGGLSGSPLEGDVLRLAGLLAGYRELYCRFSHKNDQGIDSEHERRIPDRTKDSARSAKGHAAKEGSRPHMRAGAFVVGRACRLSCY